MSCKRTCFSFCASCSCLFDAAKSCFCANHTFERRDVSERSLSATHTSAQRLTAASSDLRATASPARAFAIVFALSVAAAFCCACATVTRCWAMPSFSASRSAICTSACHRTHVGIGSLLAQRRWRSMQRNSDTPPCSSVTSAGSRLRGSLWRCAHLPTTA